MQLVLDTRDLRISRERGVFLIEPPKGKARRISPKKLSSIAVTARVWLGADAVMLATENQLPILFFDRIGKAKARLWSPYFESIATLRRQQIKFQEGPEATRWMVELFELKTIHQIKHLQHLQRRRSGAKRQLQQTAQKMEQQATSLRSLLGQPINDCRSRMMGVEGNIAKLYWAALGSALPSKYTFKGRSRRPALDPFNAALNYLYGMLYSVVEASAFAAGLDPHLGLLHADEYNKPTLAFDLIEPFRPWVDRLLTDACLDKEVLTQFFTKNQYGLFLNKEGKGYFIPLFNDWLREPIKWQQQTASRKNQIYRLAQRLAQRLRQQNQ